MAPPATSPPVYDAFYFSTGPQEQKAKNLDHDYLDEAVRANVFVVAPTKAFAYGRGPRYGAPRYRFSR